MTKSDIIKILVVDDDKNVRNSLAQFLEDSDMEPTQAANGEDALALLKQNSYNIIIVDLRLPGITGETVIMQAYRENPSTRFIIHTGSVAYQLSDELQAIGLNAENVFIKPLPDMQLLVNAIRRLH